MRVVEVGTLVCPVIIASRAPVRQRMATLLPPSLRFSLKECQGRKISLSQLCQTCLVYATSLRFERLIPSTHTIMDWEALFEHSDVKVLFYLSDHGVLRYTELLRGIGLTRGALAVALKDLRRRKLLQRDVESTTPVQTKYRLTDKGRRLVIILREIKNLLQ